MFELLVDVMDPFLLLLFSHPKLRHSNTAITESKCVHLQESDRTLREDSFGAAIPRHFVSGYDRTVPPGQKPFAMANLIKLALIGLKPGPALSKRQRPFDALALAQGRRRMG
jgi:hypothetical protein